MKELIRRVKFDGYVLELFDTGKYDTRGCTNLAYCLISPKGVVIFDNQNFFGSPMHSDDSDETIRNLLGFLTLRIGDTDREYFDNYNEVQIDFRDNEAEVLSIWAWDECEFEEMET